MTNDRITWIHLSDYHAGARGQPIWARVRASLEKSVKEMHANVGCPPDLVLFTGDLANQGKREEYDAVDSLLDDLSKWCDCFLPVFAVPGNHDVARPKVDFWKYDALSNPRRSAAVRAALHPAEPPTSIYEVPLSGLFPHYLEWMQRRVVTSLRLAGQAPYLSRYMPGDLSVVFEKGALRLGLVGLNSAWTHYRDRRRRSLLMEHWQLEHALSDQGEAGLASWFASVDAAFLLTHHPIHEWMSDASQRSLNPLVEGAGRFTLAAYGHCHTSRAERYSQADDAPPAIQCTSLFGLDAYATGTESREFGYSWGQINSEGEVNFWQIPGNRSTFDFQSPASPRGLNPGIARESSRRRSTTASTPSLTRLGRRSSVMADLLDPLLSTGRIRTQPENETVLKFQLPSGPQDALRTGKVGEHAKVQDIIDSEMHDLIRDGRLKESPTEALLVVIDSFVWHDMRGTWQRWISLYGEAITQLSRSACPDKLISRGWNRVGVCRRMVGNEQDALSAFNSALQATVDAVERADAFSGISDIHRISETPLQDLSQAFRYADKSAQAANEAPSGPRQIALARSYEMKGLAYAARLDFAMASTLQVAATAMRSHQRARPFARSASHLLFANGLSDEPILADDAFKTALEISGRLADIASQIRVCGDMAMVELRRADREMNSESFASGAATPATLRLNAAAGHLHDARRLLEENVDGNAMKRNRMQLELRLAMLDVAQSFRALTLREIKPLADIGHRVDPCDWISGLKRFDIATCDASGYFATFSRRFQQGGDSVRARIAGDISEGLASRLRAP